MSLLNTNKFEIMFLFQLCEGIHEADFQTMAYVVLKNEEIQCRTKKGKRQNKKGVSETISISLHPNHNNHFFPQLSKFVSDSGQL